MDEQLQNLERLMSAFNKKTIIEDDFVAAFKLITDHIKATNDATASALQNVFGQLNDFATQLKGDNEADRTTVKTAVGQAIAELRTELDKRMENVKSGVDGAPGTPGKDADEQKIVETVLTKIPPPKELVAETPDSVTEKVNQSQILIKKERVEGLLDTMRQAVANGINAAVGITTTIFFKNGSQVGRAKNVNFIEGTSTTLNLYQTGDQMNVSISSTASGGGTAVAEEVPSGTINGSNVTFTVAHTPLAGTFRLYLNGTRQQAGGGDYSLSGTTITFNTAPQTGSVLFVDYSY